MSKKYRSVEVNTPKGPRTLQYMYGENSGNSDKPINTCQADCIYEKVCKLLPDPERSEEFTKYRFCDFCTRIGDNADTDEGRELRKMVPVPGCLENELGDVFPRIIEVIQEKNPIIYLSDVIDCVCGYQCEFYDKDHSQCGKGNSLCLLQDLFFKGNSLKERNQPVRKLDTSRDITGESEKP